MGLGKIYVYNDSDTEVDFKLTWGLGDGFIINQKHVKPKKGDILECELVWYDLRVLVNNNEVTRRVVYGNNDQWHCWKGDDGIWHLDWGINKASATPIPQLVNGYPEAVPYDVYMAYAQRAQEESSQQ